MRKKEMSKKQLETYVQIRERLSASDFVVDDDAWFEKGLTAEPEIGASFDNGDMELLLEYTIKTDVLGLTLIDLSSDQEVIFDLYPEKKLDAVLKYLDSFKEKINGDNFREYINELVKVCPKVFTYREDQAFELKPDDE